MSSRHNRLQCIRAEVSEARRLIADCIKNSFDDELTPREDFDRLLKKLDKGGTSGVGEA
jgi:hypothetical protein